MNSLHARETAYVAGRLATPFPLEVCVDCLSLLANGASTEHEERAARDMHERHASLGKWSIGWFISLGHLSDQCHDCALAAQEDNALDCGTPFSWAPCDGCGSTLGGSRYAATLWEAIW